MWQLYHYTPWEMFTFIIKRNAAMLQQCEFGSVNFYVWPCFAGDFGGYFGLFLGGSVISLFEIFDLIIYNAFMKLAASRTVEPQVIRANNLAEEQIWSIWLDQRSTAHFVLFIRLSHICCAAWSLVMRTRSSTVGLAELADRTALEILEAKYII